MVSDYDLIYKEYETILSEAFSDRSQHSKFHKQMTSPRMRAGEKESAGTNQATTHAIKPETLARITARNYNNYLEKEISDGYYVPLTGEESVLDSKTQKAILKMKQERILDKLFRVEHNGDIIIPFFDLPEAILTIMDHADNQDKSVKTVLAKIAKVGLSLLSHEDAYKAVYEDSAPVIITIPNQASQLIEPKDTYNGYYKKIIDSLSALDKGQFINPEIIRSLVEPTRTDINGLNKKIPFITHESERNQTIFRFGDTSEKEHRLSGLNTHKIQTDKKGILKGDLDKVHIKDSEQAYKSPSVSPTLHGKLTPAQTIQVEIDKINLEIKRETDISKIDRLDIKKQSLERQLRQERQNESKFSKRLHVRESFFIKDIPF